MSLCFQRESIAQHIFIKAHKDIKTLTITSFCTTQSFYDLKKGQKKYSRPTLRPNKYPKN